MSRLNFAKKQNFQAKAQSFPSVKRIQMNHPRQQLKQLINDSITSQSRFSNSSISESEVVDQGKQKLIELTRQCSHYFQKYTAENDQHIKIIINIFAQFSHQIQATFNKIMQSVGDKLEQIKEYLQCEEIRLIDQRKQQQQSLNVLLMKIHTVHLTRIEESARANNQDLTAYAFTLNQFFNKMEQIQCKINENNIQESINFISNLSKEELTKLVTQHFTKETIQNQAVSVQLQNYFTFEDDCNKPMQQSSSSKLFRPSIKSDANLSSQLHGEFQKIKQNHALRQKRARQYNDYLEGNHFFGVKLGQ